MIRRCPSATRFHCRWLRRELDKDHDLAAGYLQEASLGMVVGTPLCGQPVTLRGMHPRSRLSSFTVPPAPSIEIEVEGERLRCRPCSPIWSSSG